MTNKTGHQATDNAAPGYGGEIPEHEFVRIADAAKIDVFERKNLNDVGKLIFVEGYIQGAKAEYLRHLSQPSQEAGIEDYKEVLADHDRLVREIDLIINGDGAAKQASLIDLVGDIKKLVAAKQPSQEAKPSQVLRWETVKYKTEFSNPIMTDDSPRPKDKHAVLVKVEGQRVFYVAWCKTWSDGAFWIIPGGTPDSQAGKPFIVTHYCDCLPPFSESPSTGDAVEAQNV